MEKPTLALRAWGKLGSIERVSPFGSGHINDTYLVEAETTWQEGDRIQLEFDFGKGSFTLAVDELERVVME